MFLQAATPAIDQNRYHHSALFLVPKKHQHDRRLQNQAALRLVVDASGALDEESLIHASRWVTNKAKRNLL